MYILRVVDLAVNPKLVTVCYVIESSQVLYHTKHSVTVAVEYIVSAHSLSAPEGWVKSRSRRRGSRRRPPTAGQAEKSAMCELESLQTVWLNPTTGQASPQVGSQSN